MTPAASTMPAAVYRRPGELDVTEVPLPELGPHDALVRVAYCGLCGTDLHMVLDGWGTPDTILGHEWSGRVAAAGAEARIDEGTPVVGRGWTECGRCQHCRAGQPGLCVQRPLAGIDDGHSGAFARYLVTDHRNLTAVPDGLSLREAAYAEPLAVAMHAVTRGSFRPGGRAMVFGCGPIGAAVVAVLIAHDGEVTVVEPSEPRQDLARRLGAVVRSADELETPDHPGQVPADAVGWVFETSGARRAAQAGLTQLAGGGTMVIVGIGMDYPKLDTNRMILNELVVTGAYEYDPDGLVRRAGANRLGCAAHGCAARTRSDRPRWHPRRHGPPAFGRGGRKGTGATVSLTDFKGPSRFNHVAMSVPADLLDEAGRAAITRFYGEVFGWREHPTMTEDRKRLVMGVQSYDQFVFVIADDNPMQAPRGDHFGMAVDSLEELKEVLRRAEAFAASDGRVDIMDYEVEDFGVLKLHSFYVRYLLPLMVEVQFFEMVA